MYLSAENIVENIIIDIIFNKERSPTPSRGLRYKETKGLPYSVAIRLLEGEDPTSISGESMSLEYVGM